MYRKVVYILGFPCYEMPDGSYKRVSRGRVVNTGRYGEPTECVRVPVSLLSVVERLKKEVEEQAKKCRPSASNRFYTSPGIDLNNIRWSE